MMRVRHMLAIGTGVGLEITGRDFQVNVVRVRPGGIKVLGSAAIAGFRERPAAEWGAEYAEFLRRTGVGHLAATVLVPRSEVIVRQLVLPGVSDRDLASAIQYQIDSLHPYGEEDVEYAWARIPATPVVLVGIARRAVVEGYSQLFVEAGIKIASFTFSAAVVYSALRILSTPPPQGFLAIGGAGDCEVYGESPAHPVLSVLTDAAPEEAATRAVAELRLPPETQPLALAAMLPKPASCPADYDLSGAALLYSTALAGACPRLALGANLLPAKLRSSSSRIIFVPTVALAAILLLLVAALAAHAAFQERRRLSLLDAEIKRLEPRAIQAAALERDAQLARGRIRLLDDFRGRTRADLDALNDLTRLLQPPAWLNNLDMNRDSVVLAGQIEQSAPLLKLLDNSPHFQRSEFSGQIGKSGKSEVFRIRAARKGVAP